MNEEAAIELIKRMNYLTLAVSQCVGSDHEQDNLVIPSGWLKKLDFYPHVWACPLFFVADVKKSHSEGHPSQLVFYFASADDAVHVCYAERTSWVSVVIFDSSQKSGTCESLQIYGACSRVDPSADQEEHRRAVSLFQDKTQSDHSSPGKGRSIFRVIAFRVFVPDRVSWQTDHLDRRLELDLKEVCHRFAGQTTLIK